MEKTFCTQKLPKLSGNLSMKMKKAIASYEIIFVSSTKSSNMTIQLSIQKLSAQQNFVL